MRYLLITFLLTSVCSYAQKDFLEVDYEQIEKNLSKKKSGFNYDDLYARFVKGDSTFTPQERIHLYYGFTTRPEYSPYGSSDYEDTVKQIFKKDALEEADYRALAAACDSVLAEDPFNLSCMNYKLKVADELGDEEMFERELQKIKNVIDAIMSTGDGLKQETAFYVIDVSHEYDLLGILGFRFGGQQSLIGKCDRLELAENQYDIEGLYFNVSACLDHLSKQLR